MSTKITARNICRLYREATLEQRTSGREWYRDAHDIAAALAERHALPVADVAGVIAALSPLRSWGDNVTLAARAIRQNGLESGAFKDSVHKVNAILRDCQNPGDVLGGDKVRAFWHCIATAGETSAVCIDRHAYDAATNTRHSYDTRPRLSSKRYAEVAAAYVRASQILSAELGERLTPSAVQATVWLVWRAKFWAAGAYDSYTLGEV